MTDTLYRRHLKDFMLTLVCMYEVRFIYEQPAIGFSNDVFICNLEMVYRSRFLGKLPMFQLKLGLFTS